MASLQFSDTFSFSPAGVIQYTAARSTGAATARAQGPSTTDAAQVRYDASAGSYTLSGLVVPQVAFGSVDKVAASTNATVTAYQKTTGTRQDNLALFNAGSGNPVLALTYVSYGAQQSITDRGSSLDVDTAFFTFGIATALSDMPRTGTASYRTNLDGQFADASGVYALGGASSLTADFAAATVAFSMTPIGTNVVNGGAKTFGTQNINAAIRSGTNRFNGDSSTNAEGYRGALSGAFYGPQAVEVGGAFSIVGHDGFGTGAVVGRKN
uniref:transferrin-binding protein-like solute binding protein n=1 Tax=Sphingomonas populi TaxID=2484750 RepID=UPI0013EE54EB|nr:transferrin-binding protein-like solute binding protein [Sphingomonas populi]